MQNRQTGYDEHKGEECTHQISLLLPDLVHPANVGSIFRVADAFGIEHIYLAGDTPVPPNRRIRKTSRSTERMVPFSYSQGPMEVISELQMAAYRIISLEQTTQSIDIREFEVTSLDKFCLIIGSEFNGVSPELLDQSEAAVHIPMYGQNSSMNVAAATSVAVYELLNKHYRIIQK